MVAWTALLLVSSDSKIVFAGSTTTEFTMVPTNGGATTNTSIVLVEAGPIAPPEQLRMLPAATTQVPPKVPAT